MTRAVNPQWAAHAYPLRQVVVKLQGTKNSSKQAVIEQLETVLGRLRAGDVAGCEHDDDFGYVFEYVDKAPGPGFFVDPSGRM